ncbi:hypothetical protein TYRP_008029 [Tyrophagus putrescentiae]|nr:hypothetical protein TYRP_008029 [Tyrophagus putrescentiae]
MTTNDETRVLVLRLDDDISAGNRPEVVARILCVVASPRNDSVGNGSSVPLIVDANAGGFALHKNGSVLVKVRLIVHSVRTEEGGDGIFLHVEASTPAAGQTNLPISRLPVTGRLHQSCTLLVSADPVAHMASWIGTGHKCKCKCLRQSDEGNKSYGNEEAHSADVNLCLCWRFWLEQHWLVMPCPAGKYAH